MHGAGRDRDGRPPLSRQAAEICLAATPGPAARDRVLVLVTDGQVGGEDQILAALEPPGWPASGCTLIGIDRSVNEGLPATAWPQLGGGRCELVESEDRLDEVMAQIHRRIGTPLVTGLRLAAEGWTVAMDTVTPAGSRTCSPARRSSSADGSAASSAARRAAL